MGKKLIVALILTNLAVFPAFSQIFGEVANEKVEEDDLIVDEGRGFTAQVETKTDLFRVTNVTFSDENERNLRAGSFLVDNYPFGGTNILDGTGVGFSYNDTWYGGGLSVNKDGLAGIKAWIGFLDNRIKVSVGNDIGYGYADSQGADAGLRVYDDSPRNSQTVEVDEPAIDTSKNPDNITTDNEGVLLEFDFAPVKIALAGGGNLADLAANHGAVQTVPHTGTSPLEFTAISGYSMQYGANVGGKIGDFAKINGAYVVQLEKNQSRYRYYGSEGVYEVNPVAPDVEMTTHLFGAYGSVYPFGNDTLGITIGYAGEMIQYLEEFAAKSTTSMPRIIKNGINLTARYKRDKLTIKTDHNYSFWTDRNYRIFRLHNPADPLKDYGFVSADDPTASAYADVTHSFLWNGIGVSYFFTPVIEGSLYTRNLLRIDEAGDYRMANDYYSVEVKSIFHFSPMVEAYVSVIYQYTGRTVSAALSQDVGDEFIAGFAAKDVDDTRHVIQVPIGLKVKLQR